MSKPDTTPHPVGRSLAELDRSLASFRQKVDANYVAFFDELPSVVEEKRNLFQLWLHRSTGAGSKRKR